MEVVFLHWLLKSNIKHFNNFTCVQEPFCYLCFQHLIMVHYDYHDACLPREEVTASCILGAFQANMQKGQRLNINIGVTVKKRWD